MGGAIISDRDFDRLPASEQGLFMRIRKPDGGSEWRRRTDQPGATFASKVSDEEYNRMTPAERWSYARSFPQDQWKQHDR
jgi:hypothetical protein